MTPAIHGRNCMFAKADFKSFFGLLSAFFLVACGGATLCGSIYFPLLTGTLFPLRRPANPISISLATGYAIMALVCVVLHRFGTHNGRHRTGGES